MGLNCLTFLYSVGYSSLYLVHHKKYETLSTNPLIHIYINSINNRLVLKIKVEYKVELQIPKSMKLKKLKNKKAKNNKQ